MDDCHETVFWTQRGTLGTHELRVVGTERTRLSQTKSQHEVRGGQEIPALDEKLAAVDGCWTRVSQFYWDCDT